MHKVSVGILNSVTRCLRHSRRIRNCLLSKCFILVTVIFSLWKKYRRQLAVYVGPSAGLPNGNA
jgi:hypothetical protein